MTRRAAGLRSRLLVAHLLVVLAGSLALGVVAVLVAPAIFRSHLERAGDTDPMVRSHAQQAFDSAFGISLGVGTLIAMITAAVASTVIVRRLSAPVTQLADAADALAAGNYDTRVPDAQLGPEFDRLTAAFTDMAARLARTEVIRRRLMADLAHEMRTPVSTLAAHVDGLEDGVVAPEPATWAVLRGQLERLGRLSTDMAQLSAAQEHSLSLQPRRGDLGEIARAAVDAAAPAYRAKAVDLRLQCRNHLTVVVDAGRLQQVLAGLLDNALRHTPPQGQVTVTVDGSVVAVTDTGNGIAADELDAVFDRFHRVDGARARVDGGSGLGLTIARAITAAHGGTLTARSSGLGAGSTFVLRLPVVSR
jgi:two-component system, OmpR family, sensor histidine kinase BaeS